MRIQRLNRTGNHEKWSKSTKKNMIYKHLRLGWSSMYSCFVLLWGAAESWLVEESSWLAAHDWLTLSVSSVHQFYLEAIRRNFHLMDKTQSQTNVPQMDGWRNSWWNTLSSPHFRKLGGKNSSTDGSKNSRCCRVQVQRNATSTISQGMQSENCLPWSCCFFSIALIPLASCLAGVKTNQNKCLWFV